MTKSRPTEKARHLAAVVAALVLGVATFLGTLPAGAADTWSTTLTVTEATEAAGLSVQVQGTGFTDLPAASSGAPAAGVYVAMRDKSVSHAEINDDNSKALAVLYLPSVTFPTGSFDRTVHVDADQLDPDAVYEVFTWVAHGSITNQTLLTWTDVPLTVEHKQALFPGWTPPTTTTTLDTSPPTTDQTGSTVPSTTTPDSTTPDSSVPGSTVPGSSTSAPATTRPATTVAPRPTTARPTTPPAAAAPTGPHCVLETVTGEAGVPQMTWGVKSSFVNYIESAIAKGSVETGGGVVRNADDFTWTTGSGGLDQSNQGTWTFDGFVHFSGHDGVLNLNLSNLRVQVNGGNAGVLVADVDSTDMEGTDVGGDNVTVATLAFSGVDATGGTATVTLTAAGASAFASYYEAGETLDPLTVRVADGGTHTVEVCYDADGNVVSSAGRTGALAATGFGDRGLVGVGALLVALGAVAWLTARRHADAFPA